MIKSASLVPMVSGLVINCKLSNFKQAIHTSCKECPSLVRRNASTKIISSSDHLPTSAYVHLPFCRKRCHYCDFPIVALGSSQTKSHDDEDPRMTDYVNLLCREIMATRLDFDQCPPVKTVFFGGGTPSLVPPRLVGVVLETLRTRVGVSGDAEISMEMDPGTFGKGKLEELMGLGVNRVSLGVQAFQDELLKFCGRAHGILEVYEAISIVKSCGLENWSMDLISSLPHQTANMWDESLRLSIAAQPSHVSVYDLQVEQGTKFGTLFKPGEFPLPSENQSAEFYKMASRVLTDAGFEHYEISSYCKPGFQCKHNVTYWDNGSFYAFGLGAASYLHGVRFSRPRRMKEYASYVQNLESGSESRFENMNADLDDSAMDIVMLSLRTARGLETKSFEAVFGSSLVASLYHVYKPFAESGHVLFLDEHRKQIPADELMSLDADERDLVQRIGFIRLSDPDGFLLSNELISAAFAILAP